MATTTSKLGLTKPATSDNVDIAVFNTNADKLDAAVGLYVCTSTSRPASPWNGLSIYETDTKDMYVYLAASSTWTKIADGTTLGYLSNKIWVQSTEPVGATNGDLWFWGS